MADRWQPKSNLPELDSRLENAFKRVSGLVGFRLGQDRMNTDALRSTAASLVDTGLTQAGPLFMRLGRGLSQACDYRPKGQISLKEIAADILSEFYGEGLAAFQAAKISLRGSAEEYLAGAGLEENTRRAILDSVDASFLEPSREDMTQAAVPHVTVAATPGTLACVGLIAGLALGLVVFRHPLFMALGGVVFGSLAYYIGRGRLRDKARALLTNLPRDIYSLLRQNLVTNETRYIELVNQSLTRH